MSMIMFNMYMNLLLFVVHLEKRRKSVVIVTSHFANPSTEHSADQILVTEKVDSHKKFNVSSEFQ